ncbi:MAG: response regulator transcription factor [Acidobacteriaceae bacterium]|nr:response regulator transcription factor [Acidobacteriaceae bacterium]
MANGHLGVIIVDDDAAIREILRGIAERLGVDVLAEAENGRGAIEEAERHRPELMLMDVSMPVMGGLPATRYLCERLPEMRIILVSQYDHKLYVDQAMQLGARGYVLKAAAASELGPAMKIVMDGGTFVSPRVDC